MALIDGAGVKQIGFCILCYTRLNIPLLEKYTHIPQLGSYISPPNVLKTNGDIWVSVLLGGSRPSKVWTRLPRQIMPR